MSFFTTGLRCLSAGTSSQTTLPALGSLLCSVGNYRIMKHTTHAFSDNSHKKASVHGEPRSLGHDSGNTVGSAFINFGNGVHISILQIFCIKHLDKPIEGIFHNFFFVNTFFHRSARYFLRKFMGMNPIQKNIEPASSASFSDRNAIGFRLFCTRAFSYKTREFHLYGKKTKCYYVIALLLCDTLLCITPHYGKQ